MNKTDIEWCDYTWNPITGCKRGCEYCYARKIHERFNSNPFSEIVFHPERINEPGKIKKPSRIFVGSMSDFEYWKEHEKIAVLNTCMKYYQHTFMFLSKNHTSYYEIAWPENVMLGLTVESIYCPISINMHSYNYRPFISIEPLLGVIGDFSIKWDLFEMVIVGAMTGRNATRPKKKWIDSVKNNIPADKIFWKNNIKEYL